MILAGHTDRLHVYQEPDEPCRSLKRAKYDEWGRLVPIENFENIGATDPTDYALKGDVKVGSKNAIYTMGLFDLLQDQKKGGIFTNIIKSEYYFRPENPDEYYEDLVKQILWYDMYVYAEANKKWVVTRLKADNLHNFILFVKEDGTIGPYKEGEVIKLISTTTDVINAYIRAIKRYLSKLINGVGINYTEHLKSIRLIEQLMRFDATDTKIFDLAVCFGLTLLAKEAVEVLRMQYVPKDELPDKDQLENLLNKFANM